MKLNIFLTPILLLSMTACIPSSTSPSQVYEEYNDKVIKGISFDDEKLYFTKRKIAETEQSMPKYMSQMNKSREEILALAQDFSQSIAKCKDIRLFEEKIDGNNAVLTYKQTDTCGNESNGDEKQTVKMTNENGWEIDDVEIDL